MSVSVTRDNEALRTDGVSVNPLTFNENLPEINVRTMTPISIEACAESGVNANELLRRPLSYFASLPALVSRPPEAAKAAQKQYEKMRVATLATVQASHARIQRKLADELSRPLAISPASGTGGAGAGGAGELLREGRRERHVAKVAARVRVRVRLALGPKQGLHPLARARDHGMELRPVARPVQQHAERTRAEQRRQVIGVLLKKRKGKLRAEGVG